MMAIGAIGVALAAVTFAFLFSQLAAADYRRAVPCGSYDLPGSDCYRDVAARIANLSYAAGESEYGDRYGIYTMVLSNEHDQWSVQVGQSALPRTPAVGQQVQVRIWRGTVTELTVNGWTTRTLANPLAGSGGLWGPLLIAGLVVGIAIIAVVTLRDRRQS